MSDFLKWENIVIYVTIKLINLYEYKKLLTDKYDVELWHTSHKLNILLQKLRWINCKNGHCKRQKSIMYMMVKWK